MLAAVFAVCGILHHVGSERDESLVLDDGTRRISLAGPVADRLFGSTWAHVCIEGVPAPVADFGSSMTVRVDRVRAVGDGHHAPIIGTVRHDRTKDVIIMDSGKRLTLRFIPAAASSPFIGKHVWVTGRWRDGRLDVEQIGPF